MVKQGLDRMIEYFCLKTTCEHRVALDQAGIEIRLEDACKAAMLNYS
jgi:hypothetical protein